MEEVNLIFILKWNFFFQFLYLAKYSIRFENIFEFALLLTYRYFIYDQKLSKLRYEFWIWWRV